MNGMCLDTIVNLAKRRGIAFQSSEIYGGLRSTQDRIPIAGLVDSLNERLVGT
jgi:glycyl-tRNA synthetase (class II)